MGTDTASPTARSISRSKPRRTPSVSMELTTTSPAPLSTPRLTQSMASNPVSSRPPRAKMWKRPSTRFRSMLSTTH